MFTRLFKPKWEHSDPAIRARAMASGEAPPEVVARAAAEDGDPAVRRSAVARMDDLQLLERLAGADADASVRAAAGRRWRDLLIGPGEQAPPLHQRLEAVRRAPTDSAFGDLAREAQASEVRAAVLARVEDLEVLCAAAVDDPVAAVRRSALDRIDDPGAWERVARGARNKDKQVARLARERFEAYHKARADEQAGADLCREMEALALAPPDAASRATHRRLLFQWQAITSELPPEMRKRFAAGRDLADTRIAEFEAAVAERRALCTALEALGEGLGSQQAEAATEQLEGLLGRWDAVGADNGSDAALETRFVGQVDAIRRALETRARDLERVAAMRRFLHQAESARDGPGQIRTKRIAGLKERWSRLQAPLDEVLRDELQAEFETLVGYLEARRKHQAEERRKALEEAQALLEELLRALDQGELKHAVSLHDRVRHRLKAAEGSADRKRVTLNERLHALRPRMEELKKWRHWGSGHARGHLCEEMETLAGSALEPVEIATRVRAAREAWKRIDQAEGPAGEALWKRFDEACTQAYAPYRHEQAEQARQREEHLALKQALLRELEDFERATDWGDVDWREADSRVRKAREHWRRIGPVPRKEGRALEKAYHALLERLEAHLGGERERELQRRLALIARIEALAGAEDQRGAVRQVKEAQADWRPTVQADRRREQALWKQFRAACDAVFDRLRSQREAQDTERRRNLERRGALGDEIEALLEDPQTPAGELKRRLTQVEDEWERAAPVPREAERALATRLRDLQQAVAARRLQAAKAQADAALNGMRERAAICERLESALETSADATGALEEAERGWAALGPLDKDLEGPLRERFDRAAAALGGDPAARRKLLEAMQDNLRRRLDLCLNMEIVAEVDSPPEFAQARMQLQVARLSDALHHKRDQPAAGGERLRDLLLDWYRTGPAPAEARAGLETRFQRARAGLRAD